ncbi:MAG: lytic transglycosylase domain-containing protein [Dethiobacter sp.]|nr:lytic transglycosylase domain-containing protein [Dethiobacter sp.]MBS4054034.1 lytic transglycosylase domain-containing protein [Thermaerobacter sp.]
MRRYALLLTLVAVMVVMAVLIAPSLWRIIYPWPYRDIVLRYAELHGLDPFLVAAVIRVESSFRSKAVSPKGARGLMQIIPTTGQWIASQVEVPDYSEDRLDNPETNIMMGTWYLRNLKEQFDGNLVVALAAYNGGRGNVKNWLKEGVWSGQVADIASIPFSETRHYVWRVLRIQQVYRELYGRKTQ